MDWTYLAQDRELGYCVHGAQLSGSIECWEILERLGCWKVLKEEPAPWS
jgi:hypothetical protein